MKNQKKIVFLMVAVVVACSLGLSFFFTEDSVGVTADDGGGNIQTTGCSGGVHVNEDGSISPNNPRDGYSCCGTTPDNGYLNTSCPKWIIGTAEQFAEASQHQFGTGYDQAKIAACIAAGGPVYWFGNVADARAGGGMSLRNYQNSPNQRKAFYYDAVSGTYGNMSLELQAAMDNAAATIGVTSIEMSFWCDAILCDPETDPNCPVPEEEKKDEECGTWSVGGSGVSGVAAGVKNITINTGYKKQNDTAKGLDTNAWVWAKPYDQIVFCDQYYSGIQDHRGDLVTVKNPKIPDAYHADRINYEGDNHKAQDKTIAGPDQISLLDHVTREVWDVNGFNVTGRVNKGTENFGTEAGSQNYKWLSPTVTVDPLNDIGNEHLSNNVQEVKSQFHGGSAYTTVNYNYSYNDTWNCNPYTPGYESEEKYEIHTTAADCGSDSDYDSHNFVPDNPSATITPSTPGTCSYKKVIIKYGNPVYSKCNMNPPVVGYSFSGEAMSSAYFKVPYNFTNRGDSSILSKEIYSGETVTVEGGIITDTRYNANTLGDYATIVPDARWRTFGYISDTPDGSQNAPDENGCRGELCIEYPDMSGNGSLNTSGSTTGSVHNFGTYTYNVWDVEAGRYYCIKTVVFPAVSAGDGDMDGKGTGWDSSVARCKVISKKPTFQVHGPMYIESGTIEQGRIATKNNVADEAWLFNVSKNGTGDGRTRNFYSWVDQSLTIGRKATVKRFATGAAVNVKKDNGGKNIGGIFSSVISDEIFRSRAMQPLTIPTPSVTPTNAALDGIGAVLNSSFKSTVVESAKRTASGSETCKVNGLSLKNTDSGNNRRVIVCNGTLEINGDIIYAGNFEKMEQIPSVIIYASNGINIKSNVSRIDGWVIAEGTIDTCSDGGACNKSLTFNGTVLAHEIKLNRTYGAGAGKRSSYPAELFNLSSAAFMYSASEAKKNSSKVPQTVYLRELAPRY